MVFKEKRYNPIKLKLSQFWLSRNLKEFKRQVQICSLKNAQAIGVTFCVNSPEELSEVKKVLKLIEKCECEIFALGYIPQKKPDDFYLSQKGISFFSDKDLDWLLRPKSEIGEEFLRKDFDLLIDLGSEHYYPMHYLLNMSAAKFKIGWYGENKPFDLMMNIEKTKGIEYFCQQALDYLSKINN